MWSNPMADQHTIKAWKDESYRLTLDPDERATIPASPAGTIELADADLGEVAAGSQAIITQTTVCLTSLPCFTVATIAISQNISCGACEQTLWSGSCYVSSIGCCP